MSAVDEQFSHTAEEHFWVGMRDFAAGVFGGICGVVAGQPMDFVRIRLQTANRADSQSALSLFKSALRQEGYMSIWKGMLSPIAGVSFQNAITFVSYGQAMHFLSKYLKHGEIHTLGDVWTAGTFAGLCQSIVVCPVEGVKIRLQLQTESREKSRYKGPWDCARQLWRQGGSRALYKGFSATILRDSSSYGLYFWAYEAVKRAFATADKPSQSSPMVMFFAGGVGGVLSWALCYPVDIIKTNIQADDFARPKYAGIIDCFQQIYARGGWRAFTRGLAVTCSRGFIVNGALFAGYETALELLRPS